MPYFKESGESIRRRLVVIPFDYHIKNADSSVEKRLISEAPIILSMLVRRIQENIKQNGGKFLVARDSQIHKKAQTTFLTSGNNIIEWAKDTLEADLAIPDTSYVTVDECFARYRQWCAESGINRVANKIVFGRIMASFIVPKIAETPDVKKIQGLTCRIYRRVRFLGMEGRV
jgi:phage/plasmid-associated DNA primase